MPRVIRDPSAARDLDEIFDYIAIQGGRPATAEKLIRHQDRRTTVTGVQHSLQF